MTDTPDLTLVESPAEPCTGCGADLSVDDHFDGCPQMLLEPCPECGSDTIDHYVGCALDVPDDDGIPVEDPPDEPVTFDEADGSWIYVPNGTLPDIYTSQGMLAHTVTTRCRWSWRDDHRDGEPQACCYSILTTISRIPGPVQPDRTWLSMQNHIEASQAVTLTDEGTGS